MDHSQLDDQRGEMPAGRRLAGLAFLLLLLLLLQTAAAAALAAAPMPRVPTSVQPFSDQTRNALGRKVLKEGELTKTQFRFRLSSLTNEQLVDWKGQRLTKLAFLAAAGRRIKAAHLQAIQQAAPHGQAELAAARSRFVAEETAKLAARNDQARNAARQRIAQLSAGAAAAGPAGAASPGGKIDTEGASFRQAAGMSAGLTSAPLGGGPVAEGGASARGTVAGGAGGAGDGEQQAAEQPACLQPKITYAPPFALSPGSYVAVVGCGFAAAGAEIEGNQGSPGRRDSQAGRGNQGDRLILRLQADRVDIPLLPQEWHDSWITASVPAGLAGLGDQGALLVVRTAAGDSAGWLVPFRAARELRALHGSEVPVERCATVADANYCNHEAHLDPGYWGLLDKSGAGNPAELLASAAGYHADDGSPDGDEGFDVYHVRLGHGWSLAGFAFHFDAVPGAGTAAPPQDFEPGYAEQILMVPWAISGEGSVLYYLDLFATGPRGTSPAP
jgi:hypothetical protein